jgi:hypothetical protein
MSSAVSSCTETQNTMLLLEHTAIRRRYLPACLILWSSSNKTVLLQATNFHFSHFLPRHAQRVRFRKRDTGGRVGRSSRQAGPTQRVTSLSRLYCLEQWYSTGGTRRHLRGYVDYTICITCIMYQQLWGYKVEEKYLGVREQKRLNTTGLEHSGAWTQTHPTLGPTIIQCSAINTARKKVGGLSSIIIFSAIKQFGLQSYFPKLLPKIILHVFLVFHPSHMSSPF